MKLARKQDAKGYLVVFIFFSAFLYSNGSWADNLSDLVSQRLNYMKDVAAYKWHNKLPIENLARETVVLESAVTQGLRFGLMTTGSKSFFAVQIAAAKEIQWYWFGQWRQHPNRIPESTADLNTSIRPALIALGENISQAFVNSDRSLTELRVEGLSPPMIIALNDAAQAVALYPDQLTQIQGSGLLRVGTTGDYAPFSLREGTGRAQGVDIDLAENLAQSLGVNIVWVATSWPRLMKDLHEGRYDIGMSGISVNSQRRKTAFFSLPYHQGGKTAISRCDDSGKFNSLARIDQASTIVVVNPGGTNQKFVDSNIHSAKVRVHPDNRSIFKELLEHRADVMITDLIEVQLQVAKNPGLCAAMSGKTLTKTEKAFLLPQDNIWKDYVDGWMNTQETQDLIAERFGVHVP
ncbi:MAG: gamma subclass chorismate mutase AroQ [Halioglobus sp.]